MDRAPNGIQRHLLPWDRPLLPQAAEWLAQDWRGRGPLDLADWVVVVPTRQSGRRLREALAVLAAERGTGVISPRVVLPEDLVLADPGLPPPASPVQAQLAWIEVLRGLELDGFRAVFPVDPPRVDFAWAKGVAAQLLQVQSLLAEGGLRLADVGARAGDRLPEPERWAQLAELERRCDAALAEAGCSDRQAARIAFARAAHGPLDARRIAVVGVPDPFSLALPVLERASREIPVDVLFCGSRGGEDLFDQWGRPRTSEWSRRPVPLVSFSEQVSLHADPPAEADAVARLAALHPRPAEVMAIGVARAELIPELRARLGEAGHATYDPEGRTRRQDRLFGVLEALAALVREPEFEAVGRLCRCPDVLDWLGRLHPEAGPAAVLAQLDDLHERHLPPTLAAALRHAGRFPAAALALEAIAALREAALAARFPAGAQVAVERIYAGRELSACPDLADALRAWFEFLGEVAPHVPQYPRITEAEWWEACLEEFGDERRYEKKEPEALEMAGWLELLWEDAPHLVVAGCNDGSLPEAVNGDAFLPEAMREVLGLRRNADRLARDAYILSAVAAARASGGRLDLLVGKTSVAGEPLRPSRLFFLCADEELPARTAALFAAAPATKAKVAWRRAWKLRPPQVEPPSRVAVTGLRDYLRCPFRFYLKHALRMERGDPLKVEPDAMDFGTLCHSALEAMGREPEMADCADEAVVAAFLAERLDLLVRGRYGADLSLPILVQLDSARQRLARAAAVQVEQRRAGWTILRVESKFELAQGRTTIVGKIDRVERHEPTGRVRVIDYKTSDRAVAPEDAHWSGERRDGDVADWLRIEGATGRPRLWKDLQLPLYCLALEEEFGAEVTPGYFNLPKAVSDTSVVMWEDFGAAIRGSARRCLAGAVAAIEAGQFWPPREVTERDEDDAFAGLFHRGAAESVEWRRAP